MKFFGATIWLVCLLVFTGDAGAQSRRVKQYSESRATTERVKTADAGAGLGNGAAPRAVVDANKTTGSVEQPELDVIKVETDLVIVPFRVTDEKGRTIPDIKREEVRVFENGEERELAYFSDIDQPFTVALVLDTSYSTVFKMTEIQDAAKKFVAQLRPEDRVMVVAFSEKAIVLCEPTGERKILNLAIEGAQVGSGTSLYTTLDMILNQKLRNVAGRKAIVLLSDGVDTTSKLNTAESVGRDISESDALIFPLKYNTYDDVQKQRRTTAPIQYDENDKPYTVEMKRVKGEREEDYVAAKEFLRTIAQDTGGRLYNVTSTTNLDESFANIAKELRKIYSLGYYPNSERESGASFEVKVRVYRPDLNIRTKERYIGR